MGHVYSMCDDVRGQNVGVCHSKGGFIRVVSMNPLVTGLSGRGAGIIVGEHVVVVGGEWEL